MMRIRAPRARALLCEMERADPSLGPGPLDGQTFLVTVRQLGADVVPVREIGHDSSPRFLSKANHAS
jgi:hypothetical protein